MADLSITAANVVAGANAVTRRGVAGATITAGQVVQINSETGRYILSDADAAGTGSVREFHIALNGCANGQPITVLRSGDVTIGATVAGGTSYYLSPNPGGIAPRADVLTGDVVVFLGVAKSATVLSFQPVNSGFTLT